MSTVVMGLDPGLSGGMGWIAEDAYGCHPLPILGKSPDLDEIAEVYREQVPRLVVLERVQGGKNQAGQLLMGINYGLLMGQLRTMGIPFIEVTPQRWKKDLGLKADKGEAIQRARDLFPVADLRRSEKCRKDDDGLAEGLLIAHWGRLHGGKS